MVGEQVVVAGKRWANITHFQRGNAANPNPNSPFTNLTHPPAYLPRLDKVSHRQSHHTQLVLELGAHRVDFDRLCQIFERRRAEALGGREWWWWWWWWW